MSVIIRLQNLPWSANALDIRNFFRGLSIPEGGVHIVGGELGDAFIAFSTDEDARQAMMLDGGKIKEIQVKLLLSSRSEMHKVIETARQSVPILTLTAQATIPAPVSTTTPAQIKMPTPPQPPVSAPPVITPFSAALGTVPLSSFGIPGIGNPHEIPQPAVIEPPAPMISPTGNTQNGDEEKDDDRSERKLSKEKDRRRTRSRSRSRDRDRKDRKRDRRDRSRSRDRRRRDRSRSRERRDRKRDRKDRSRSRERSPARRSRDRRNERKSPRESQEKSVDSNEPPVGLPYGNLMNRNQGPQMPMMQPNPLIPNGPSDKINSAPNRFSDPTMAEAFNKLQELGKKRNPNAFQGDQSNGAPRFPARGGANVARGGYRREGRVSRFDDVREQQDCCVAIRNAPNHTSYGDVRRFFPFMIDKHGIKMINDSMGRRTGNIYVKFCDPRSKQLALQRKGNELKGAVVAVEDLDDETYENAVDSFLPYREENDDEDVSLVIADHDEPARPPFSVLKLADLPNFVKEHDIIKAFGDFSLMSIILNDCRLSRTKTALVQFAKPDDARLAFERKDLYIFGRRQPTITVVSDEEYENEKSSQSDKPSESPRTEVPEEPIVPRDPRQRRQQNENGPRAQAGLPMQAATPTAPFFPNAPFVPQQNFGAPFPPAPQFGGFPGTGGMDPRTAATNWANRPTFPNPADQMPSLTSSPRVISTDMEDQPLDCVLMKGLPRDATDRTIVTFLSDTGAVPARIHLMLDTNGLPSGDCFCEFRSVQEARQAASKHGHNLDGCRVTVDLVSQMVVKEALVEPKQPEGMMGKGPPQYYEHPRGSYSSRPYRGRGGFDRGGYERAGHRGSFRGRGNWNERGGRGSERSRSFERGRSRGFGRGRGGFAENGRNETRNEEENDPALEGFGAPGCVVSLENVPFRATVDDILTFFSEFELTQDDIIRRYNERGQPTGDARVAFRTPFDAQRAVKTRHMDSIYDRRISLTIL
ncbi:unnamed protein product [Parnassius apollo]|uniref:(apollo) hypothetical protein n=1 Tax=Parnassius apollo TaxID=110799 RepID=A0A8S3XYK4_PARAO|nr:unnamed protein product [Parnassius apollo]